jgi:hypothetical protein
MRSCEAQYDLLPTTFPKCGTLFTYGNALVMSTLRSPSTGKIFFLVVSVMGLDCLCSWWGSIARLAFLRNGIRMDWCACRSAECESRRIEKKRSMAVYTLTDDCVFEFVSQARPGFEAVQKHHTIRRRAPPKLPRHIHQPPWRPAGHIHAPDISAGRVHINTTSS